VLQGGISDTFDGPVSKGASDPTRSDNIKVGRSYSDACAKLTSIIITADLYDDVANKPAYNATLSNGGFNSNSYAFTLLNDVGLGWFFGAPRKRAFGWGAIVPGL
jgi:hypothetical protein